GKENRVLLITNTPISAAPVMAFASARAATLTAAGRIFGGEAAVGRTLETDIENVGGAAGNFQTLNVTPTEAVTLQLANESTTGTTATTRNADNRTYTVSGLNNATTYRITLVNAASIRGTGSDRTFLSSAITGSTTAFAVNTGADIADIVGVNGAAPTFATGDTEMRTTTAKPVAGNLTFEIDGTAPGTVVPAVYLEGGPGGTSTTGGTSPRLETSATAAGAFAAATETFGLGGPTTFINRLVAPAAIDPAAGTGANSNDITVRVTVTGNVDSVVIQRATVTGGTDETATGEAGPYATVTTVDVTAADVTAGFVSFTDQDLDPGVYRYRAAVVSDGQQSAFSAEGAQPNEAATAPGPDAPAAIDPAAGTDANSNDITVTVRFTGDVDSVVIQRATVTGGTDETATGEAGPYATVTTVDVTAADVTAGFVSFTDQDLDPGVYRYRAAVVSDGQQSGFSAEGDQPNEAATAPATV
ncbi:MAG: hypothetical protein M3P31_02400, partial [Actinomycetota bacterium]|nr:hypothetical protein [Actinomycetota bacterium]